MEEFDPTRHARRKGARSARLHRLVVEFGPHNPAHAEIAHRGDDHTPAAGAMIMHHVDRPDANLPVALVVFLVLADGVRFYVLADDTDLMLSLKAGPKYLVESELWSWEPAADGSIQVM